MIGATIITRYQFTNFSRDLPRWLINIGCAIIACARTRSKHCTQESNKQFGRGSLSILASQIYTRVLFSRKRGVARLLNKFHGYGIRKEEYEKKEKFRKKGRRRRRKKKKEIPPSPYFDGETRTVLDNKSVSRESCSGR